MEGACLNRGKKDEKLDIAKKGRLERRMCELTMLAKEGVRTGMEGVITRKDTLQT